MIGGGQSAIDIAGEHAAVDRGRHRGAVWEFGDQVAPAQVDGIDAHHRRRGVDQPFDQVVRLRLAGATIGVDRHGVGKDAMHVHEHGGNVVATAHCIAGCVGGTARSARGHRRAQVGEGCHIEREKLPVIVQRQPRAGKIVAPMRGGDEILAMAGNPFHRTAEAAGGPQHQHVFRIEAVLHPEPTADIRARDLDPFRRNPEYRLGQRLANAMHALAGQKQVEGLCRGIVLANGGAVFERGDDQPVVDQFKLDDMSRASEGRLHGGRVPLLEAEGDIARDIVPQLRCAGCHGLPQIDDTRQGVVSNNHMFGGVDCGCAAFRHDKCHWLADIPHAICGQGKMVRNTDRFDCRHPRRAGQGADPIGK